MNLLYVLFVPIRQSAASISAIAPAGCLRHRRHLTFRVRETFVHFL